MNDFWPGQTLDRNRQSKRRFIDFVSISEADQYLAPIHGSSDLPLEQFVHNESFTQSFHVRTLCVIARSLEASLRTPRAQRLNCGIAERDYPS